MIVHAKLTNEHQNPYTGMMEQDIVGVVWDDAYITELVKELSEKQDKYFRNDPNRTETLEIPAYKIVGPVIKVERQGYRHGKRPGRCSGRFALKDAGFLLPKRHDQLDLL